jgi:predicted anti-sigma-YlaC factor YlaD
MEAVLAADCERARVLASQAVDCELSELERRQLRTHLAGCEPCESFLVKLRDVTHELRAAPLPRPSRPLVPRIGRRPPLYLAALLIAFAAAGGGVAGSLTTAPAPLRAHALAAVQHLPSARLPLPAAL